MEIHSLSLISISSSWLNFFIMTKIPLVSVHFYSISLSGPKSLQYVPGRQNSFMTWKNTTFFPDSHTLFRFSKFFLYCPKLIFEINYSSAISGLFHVFFPLSGKITLTEYRIVILSNTILFTGFSIIFSEFFEGLLIFQIITFPLFVLKNSIDGARVRITEIRESPLGFLSRALSIGHL